LRFVLFFVLLAALLQGPTFAAERTLSLSKAHIAAQRGDSQAGAALATTIDRQTCLNGCANRGYKKAQCAHACRPGLCHTGGEQPYCVAK
jgi:hypothetical protein